VNGATDAGQSSATKHWGSGLRRIRWQTDSNGLQTASGQDWSGVVRPRPPGGYEAEFSTTDRLEVYPIPGVSDRTPEHCKGWVRLRAEAAANRRRWVAYLGRPSPKARARESFVHSRRRRPGAGQK